jgi:hypothetical protein
MNNGRGRVGGLVAGLVAVSSAVAGLGWAAQAAPDAPAATVDAAADSAADSAADPSAQLCDDGTIPMLDIETFPGSKTVGAASVVDAVALVASRSAASTATVVPLGTGRAPAWVAAGGSTYIVTPQPDGGWFASPATLQGCDAPDKFR